MRKLLLASSTCFILVGGLALADGVQSGSNSNQPSIQTSIPVVKNSLANNGSSSATSGGVAVTAKLNDVGNATNSDNLDITKNLTDVGNKNLSVVRTDTNVNVTLATSKTEGNIENTTLTVQPGTNGNSGSNTATGVATGAVSANTVNGGQGILTSQQNSGLNSMQQNSVALGSVTTSSSGISGF